MKRSRCSDKSRSDKTRQNETSVRWSRQEYKQRESIHSEWRMCCLRWLYIWYNSHWQFVELWVVSYWKPCAKTSESDEWVMPGYVDEPNPQRKCGPDTANSSNIRIVVNELHLVVSRKTLSVHAQRDTRLTNRQSRCENQSNIRPHSSNSSTVPWDRNTHNFVSSSPFNR